MTAAISPTMEQLALAVFKGDHAAALALADAVSETHREGGAYLPPVHRLAADASRVRLVVYTDACTLAPSADDIPRMAEGLSLWLSGERQAVLLPPGCRLELYEMPEPKP
jgi:hypothetical protein